MDDIQLQKARQGKGLRFRKRSRISSKLLFKREAKQVFFLENSKKLVWWHRQRKATAVHDSQPSPISNNARPFHFPIPVLNYPPEGCWQGGNVEYFAGTYKIVQKFSQKFSQCKLCKPIHWTIIIFNRFEQESICTKANRMIPQYFGIHRAFTLIIRLVNAFS